MNRRFAKIDIKEPSIEDTFLILKGIKQKYQDFHKIKYSDKILKNIISLSDEYIKDRFLPDKAIDILDEVGSRYWVRDKKSKTVTTQDIEQVISKMSNTPIKSINTQDKKILKTLSKKLKKKIFAQDDAIDTICQSILISKAGLKRKNKPIASFLFTGESGIGKTQLAHELAHELNISFERFDMSEFMEQHSISKLIGAPAGYVGFDDGGQLTDVVKKNPHAVILLDEIEKANKELLNILLGVMDNASLKDSKGQKVDFSHTILIMTSNITSNDAKSMGFGQDSSLAGDRNIKEFFNKEFLNRLTDIIYFKPLDKTNIYKIIDKFIYSLLENIQEKNLDIEIDMSIKKEIYKQANVQTYGARNIEKVVDDLISYQLAKTLIFNKQITKSKMIIKYIDNQTLIEAG